MADQTDEIQKLRAERARQRHESRASTSYQEFLRQAEEILDEGVAFAERATEAVLCALEQRIVPNESNDLNDQLPMKVVELLNRCELHAEQLPRKLNRAEFIDMVASELDTDTDHAEAAVKGVFQVLSSRVSDGEIQQVVAALPYEFADLWPKNVQLHVQHRKEQEKLRGRRAEHDRHPLKD